MVNTNMAVNWAYDEGVIHQGQCPRAYMPDRECLCMESTRNSVHVTPAFDNSTHQLDESCPCFPSIINYDKDGELVWLHQVIS